MKNYNFDKLSTTFFRSNLLYKWQIISFQESDRLREEKLQISGMVASDENKMSDLWKSFLVLKRSFNEVNKCVDTFS